MHRAQLTLGVSLLFVSCINKQDDTRSPTTSMLTAATHPLAIVSSVGIDTLTDSASIHQLRPEPDGSSVAFIFADPGKGITGGLGLIQTSGGSGAQLAWPDSVTSFWWSGPHQLSFRAGTGRGVRVVVDAHASQLQALDVTGRQGSELSPLAPADSTSNAVLARAQAYIDSIRVQPEGAPQQSVLRYEVDSIIIAPSDTFAAAHVLASDVQGTKVNPTWYLVHLPSGRMQAIDSLTGRSRGLPSTAGGWTTNGVFYYAKEKTIWQAQPRAQ